MSRWIDSFSNHAFNATWEDLKTQLEKSEVDETIISNVEELARLKKVIAFIDNTLNNMEPELVPLSFLGDLNNQISECRNQISNFNSNKDIGYITNANAYADNLLSYVRPYLLSSSALKKSLLGAIQSYINEIDKHLSRITDTEAEYKKVQKFREEIEEYYNLLFVNSSINDSSNFFLSNFPNSIFFLSCLTFSCILLNSKTYCLKLSLLANI